MFTCTYNYTVTYTFNSVSTCYYTFTLTIQDSIISSAVQTASESCIGASDGSINLSVNGGTSPFSYFWSGPGTFSGTTEDVSSLSAGLYNVVVTDNIGCISNGNATVSVTTDITNPTITCVGNQAINSSIGTCQHSHSGTTWNATATDNCLVASITYALTGVTTGTGTSLNGVVFNLGLTTVTWTATDGSGNTSTCSYTVTVTDNQNPTALNCAAIGNQSVTSNTGVCTYTVSGTAWNATASDNCSIASITYALLV